MPPCQQPCTGSRAFLIQFSGACRCLESVHTPGEEPKNFSGYVRGGVHKLVDPTLVSVDAEWDYTVGLADYLACACATPHVPRDRSAYQAYRRTLVPFEEAESIALAAHKGLMLSEEKIKRLCVLGDLLLCSDLCLLRVFAAAIGSEDLRAALGVQRVHSPSCHTSHVTSHTLLQCPSGRAATGYWCPTRLLCFMRGAATLRPGAGSSSA